MITILAIVLASSAAWCWGHRTARIAYRPIGALPGDDTAALDAHNDREES